MTQAEQILESARKEIGLKISKNKKLYDRPNYKVVSEIARIEGMDYLNIGFSVISRAVFVGLKTAVSEMKRAIQ